MQESIYPKNLVFNIDADANILVEYIVMFDCQVLPVTSEDFRLVASSVKIADRLLYLKEMLS